MNDIHCSQVRKAVVRSPKDLVHKLKGRRTPGILRTGKRCFGVRKGRVAAMSPDQRRSPSDSSSESSHIWNEKFRLGWRLV